MKLTFQTFKPIIKNIRAIYGPSWRSDINIDPDGPSINETTLIYFQNCQEVIPEEMAVEMLNVYRTCREFAPRSPYDIALAYIDKKLERAKTSDFVIKKLAEAIQSYNSSENDSPFESQDAFLFNNVIPMLPCSGGVKAFYLRNKRKIERLALKAPADPEAQKIYNDLEKDYENQLIICERRAIIEMIDHTALPTGNNNKKLEA